MARNNENMCVCCVCVCVCVCVRARFMSHDDVKIGQKQGFRGKGESWSATTGERHDYSPMVARHDYSPMVARHDDSPVVARYDYSPMGESSWRATTGESSWRATTRTGGVFWNKRAHPGPIPRVVPCFYVTCRIITSI